MIIGLLIALAVWGWFDVRDRGVVDPQHRCVHKTDLTVYTEAGAAFFDGREPYDVTNPRGWGYLYPPLFAMLLAPSQLPSENQVLGLVHRQLAGRLGLLPANACGLARASCGRGDPRGAYRPIPPGWRPPPSAAADSRLNCLQRGQVGVPKLYLLLLGLRLLVESRSACATFAGRRRAGAAHRAQDHAADPRA